MKLLASAMLVGAASAALTPPAQQVLKKPNHDAFEDWSKLVSALSEPLSSLPATAMDVIDKLSQKIPDFMQHMPTLPAPKAHTRRPDRLWDYVVKGEDVQSVWIENKDGQLEREVDGKLENFNLRGKKIDPSKLGVDPTVKQYSGYLDDEEEDKHLFYCMPILSFDLYWSN